VRKSWLIGSSPSLASKLHQRAEVVSARRPTLLALDSATFPLHDSPVEKQSAALHAQGNKPHRKSVRQSPPRIVVRLSPTGRHCAIRWRNVKQLFFKNPVRENQDLRSLKHLFRANAFPLRCQAVTCHSSRR
jgi:hypothetical protein